VYVAAALRADLDDSPSVQRLQLRRGKISMQGRLPVCLAEPIFAKRNDEHPDTDKRDHSE